MKRDTKQQEINEALVSLASFGEAYNGMLPVGFPRATDKILREFQLAYASLFRNGDSWSIDKHRKRFMDWHSTQYPKR